MPTILVDVAYCNEVHEAGWQAMAEHGVIGAYIRLSQGVAIYDTEYAEHWRESQAAGLMRGIYHVYDPRYRYTRQVEWIKSHYAGDGELPVCLDVELDLQYSNAYLINEVNGMLEYLKQLYPRVLLYSGSWWWNVNMTPTAPWMKTYNYWLASYPYAAGRVTCSWEQLLSTYMPPMNAWPAAVAGGCKPVMWQFSGDKFVLPGVDGALDLDLFNGSAEEFKAWVKGEPVPVPDMISDAEKVKRLWEAHPELH